MGGICGFVDRNRQCNGDCYADIVSRMADRLRHRGPDDSGVWVDADAGLALGFRRLSVIDLTLQGRQPMVSHCGRYVIVFDGEIYNYRQIRSELESEPFISSIPWKGHSDTEVMLAAISHWGLEGAIQRFNGMFGFALWDRREKILYLARDRTGVKPLYYGWAGKVFLFGSELKALAAHPVWRNEIDRGSLALFLTQTYIQAPYSIYRDIYKLLPGMILRLPAGSVSEGREFTTRTYWSAREAAETGENDPLNCSEEDALAQLDALMRDAVKMRMGADVPLGAFLSGGVDTSAMVALMQAQSGTPIKTFTIGFHEPRYNEAVYARAIAEHLGTDHSELYISAQDALDAVPLLPACYDEPFSDSSQIPTFILSRYARRHVTVGVSGDGGDIMFLGLSRYKKVSKLLKKGERLPKLFRLLYSTLVLSVPPTFLSYALSRFLSNPGRCGHKVNKLRKKVAGLDYQDKFDLYIKFVSRPKSHVSLIRDAGKIPSVLADRDRWADVENFLQWISALDLISFLPDKIMVKVERAGMGVGLEVRSPLLDHRVVEFALQLPVGMKVKAGRSKWLLRQVLYRYVPPNLIERPKKGFNAPVGLWLKGPLRNWAEALLDEKRLREEGFFHQKLVRKQWEEHLSGKMDWGYYLWDLLMFQSWLEEQKG